METMTPGRVHIHVEDDDVKSVVYFDRENRRSMQIDVDHPHRGVQPHVHHGYNRSENDSEKGAARLTPGEARVVENVVSIWQNRNCGK